MHAHNFRTRQKPLLEVRYSSFSDSVYDVNEGKETRGARALTLYLYSSMINGVKVLNYYYIRGHSLRKFIFDSFNNFKIWQHCV